MDIERQHMFMDTHTKAHNYTQTDQSQIHEKEKLMLLIGRIGSINLHSSIKNIENLRYKGVRERSMEKQGSAAACNPQ